MILAARPFVTFADYWIIQNDLRQQIKLRFDQEGITIPLPQRHIHLHQVAATDPGDEAQPNPSSRPT